MFWWQYFCFYYMFKTNFPGHNTIWGVADRNCLLQLKYHITKYKLNPILKQQKQRLKKSNYPTVKQKSIMHEPRDGYALAQAVY